KLAPVVRSNLVQRCYDVVEDVGHRLGRSTFAAVKRFAEIVERPPALRFLPNEHVRFQPDQVAFAIKVNAAPPGSAFGAGEVKQLCGDGGIGERAPGGARLMVEHGGSEGEGFQKIL